MSNHPMRNYPAGFGMQMMHNVDAMDYFMSLSQAQRDEVAAECTNMRSSDEMRAYVNGMAKKKNS